MQLMQPSLASTRHCSGSKKVVFGSGASVTLYLHVHGSNATQDLKPDRKAGPKAGRKADRKADRNPLHCPKVLP